MPTPIIEQSVFIEGNILTPTVGDTNYSVTVDNTIQNLANRTKWIKDNYGTFPEYGTIPSSPTDTGTQGQRAYSNYFIYECVATNTWVRYAAATTW